MWREDCSRICEALPIAGLVSMVLMGSSVYHVWCFLPASKEWWQSGQSTAFDYLGRSGDKQLQRLLYRSYRRSTHAVRPLLADAD